MSGKYTREMFEEFRKEEDEKATKQEERPEKDGEGERPPCMAG